MASRVGKSCPALLGSSTALIESEKKEKRGGHIIKCLLT